MAIGNLAAEPGGVRPPSSGFGWEHPVRPGDTIGASVVDRGWELEVVTVGALGAELRWPDILVPPFRGTPLRLHVKVGGAEAVVGARVRALRDDGCPGIRVTVEWDEAGRPRRDLLDRRRAPRWAAPTRLPEVRIVSPLGPPVVARFHVVDGGARGLGIEAITPTGALLPGLTVDAQAVFPDGPRLPIRLRLGRARATAGVAGPTIRFGAEVVAGQEALAPVLGAWLLEAAPGVTPVELLRAGLAVPGVRGVVHFEVRAVGSGDPLSAERFAVVGEHGGREVARVHVQHAGQGRAELVGVHVDAGYRCADLAIGLWEALSVALVERGVVLLGGLDPEGVFGFVGGGRAAFEVDLRDVLTGAGQTPREWRAWNAAAWATARARGALRAGFLRGTRAVLYRAVAGA